MKRAGAVKKYRIFLSVYFIFPFSFPPQPNWQAELSTTPPAFQLESCPGVFEVSLTSLVAAGSLSHHSH